VIWDGADILAVPVRPYARRVPFCGRPHLIDANEGGILLRMGEGEDALWCFVRPGDEESMARGLLHRLTWWPTGKRRRRARGLARLLRARVLASLDADDPPGVEWVRYGVADLERFGWFGERPLSVWVSEEVGLA
jgi:hypothetical protein